MKQGETPATARYITPETSVGASLTPVLDELVVTSYPRPRSNPSSVTAETSLPSSKAQKTTPDEQEVCLSNSWLDADGRFRGSLSLGKGEFSHHWNGGPEAIIQHAPTRLSRVSRELLKTPEFKRLDGLIQMHSFYTSFGESFDHTRLPHCLVAAEIARNIALHAGLPEQEVLLAEVAALSHELGTSPLSHAGERVLDEYLRENPEASKREGFDHDEHVLDILKRPHFEKILRAEGITPSQITEILDDRSENPRYQHLNFLVKEVADRLAYLVVDLGKAAKHDMALHRNQLRCWQIATDLGSFLRRIHQVKENGRKLLLFREDAIWKSVKRGPGVYAREPRGHLVEALKFRKALFQNYSAHPGAMLVNRVLRSGIRELFDSGAMDPDEFKEMTDKQVLQRYREFGKGRFVEYLEGNVDEAFEPLLAFRLSQFKDSVAPADLEACQDLIEEHIAAKFGIDRDQVFAFYTPDYSKSVTVYCDDSNDVRQERYTKLRLDDPVREHFLILGAAVSKEALAQMVERGTFVDERSAMRNLRLAVFEVIRDGLQKGAKGLRGNWLNDPFRSSSLQAIPNSLLWRCSQL